ncbi:AsnC family transcriptional regulator [Aeromicrobium sp. PE09-221]|uniref:Lrp/AsnC family transcriptional regulator n=1 Tax=Aeromicrobium sp. PE09-221 TaxID=1898043 RepID=UPI000B3E9F49|nr:Lrp/AsnC family transcriptional regulator [Aeromicrobium sp. PE09-221]OUZ12409.1 AsnC family transcriptional regulator [Aeromicrobium sp. PE09-221]
MSISIDHLDAQIIALLSENARRGPVELSAALGVARNTVQARIRRLEESGVLDGFTPRVCLPRAGVGVEAFAALALEQGRLDDVIRELREIPNILEIHATTGREDLLARVATQDNAALQTLMQRILAIPGVSHSNTTLCLTTPLSYRVQPLLDQVTRAAGWGRSTPRPDLGTGKG